MDKQLQFKQGTPCFNVFDKSATTVTQSCVVSTAAASNKVLQQELWTPSCSTLASAFACYFQLLWGSEVHKDKSKSRCTLILLKSSLLAMEQPSQNSRHSRLRWIATGKPPTLNLFQEFLIHWPRKQPTNATCIMNFYFFRVQNCPKQVIKLLNLL